MKELVTYIAQSLVDRPDQVNVAEVEGWSQSCPILKAPRTILSAVSSKVKKRTVLEIIE